MRPGHYDASAHRAFRPAALLALATSLCVLLLALGAGAAHGAANLPSGFSDELVVGGLSLPTTIDWAAGDRVFVAEKSGRVQVWQNATLTEFIDVEQDVNNHHDRGLLGLAVHPDFPTSPYVYLLYTYDPPETQSQGGAGGPDGSGARVSRLVRYEADPAQNYNKAILSTETVLLGTNSTWNNIGNPFTEHPSQPPSCDNSGTPVQDCIAADSPSHTIGTVLFAPDGSLFVGSGDGADFTGFDARALRSQDVDDLAGSILRIDPLTGDGYSDNPFWDGDATSNRSKTWSYGLRNPFRFGIHPTTNEPFAGDVGWNGWEEINTGKGENFGWPCYEGRDDGVSQQQGTYAGQSICQALIAQGQGAVEAGIHAYAHASGGYSVVGGDFYTGTTYPATYQGAFFFGDYSQQRIEYLTFDGSGNVTSVDPFATGAPLVSLRRGPDTNLYYTDINNQQIRRIRYTAGGNTPPTAIAEASPTSGLAPLSVDFTGDGSFDPDAEPLTYDWDFDDGSPSSSEANPTHVYTSNGIYNATLTVTDPSSATSVDTVVITVSNTAPTATITLPGQGSSYRVGDSIAFSGIATDPEEGTLPASAFEWTVNLHHSAHVHFDFFNAAGITSGAFTATDHGDDSHLEICLTVTDSGGLEDTTCVDIFPDTVTYTIASVPGGITVDYSGETGVTPFTVETQVNGQRSITAPLHTGALTFSSWSNGGAPSHTITVGSTPQTLTVTYAPLVWDGGGATTSWSEAANWSADVVPGAGGTVTFDATSSKTAVVDAGFAGLIGTIVVDEGYGGEISFARSLDVSGDLVVRGGSVDVTDGASVVQSQSFPDFSDVSALQLNGDALQAGSVLRLAPEAGSQVGSAFYSTPVAIDGDTSFSTSFSFRIHGSNAGADGLVFLLQDEGLFALGTAGTGMGYGGVTPSVGVQIDTYANPGEPNDNHVAVMTSGSTTHVDIFSPAFDLNDGATHYMWIDYDAATDTLRVYVSQSSLVKPASPVMTTHDLASLLGSQAYLGFSAATGGLDDNHDVESWDFSVTSPNGLTVAGQVDHTGGVIRETQQVAAQSAPLAQILDPSGGVEYRGIEIDTAHNLGAVMASVTAIGQGQGESCPNGTALGTTYADRCFNVSVANEDDATVRLWATTGELNGIAVNDVGISRWTGSAWTILTASAGNGTSGGWAYVEADTDDFGQFLISGQQTPPTCAGLTQEGESGALSGLVGVGSDPLASGGSYVAMQPGSTPIYSGPNPAHRATYCVTITTPGTYQIAADIYAANNLTDSYYVTVDGTPASGYLWDTHHSTSYATDLVSDRGGANPIEITLTAGDHTIDFYAREPDTRLDTFELQLTSPPNPTCAGLTQEGESGALSGLVGVGSDPLASGGSYVAMQPGSTPIYSGPNPAHRATYCVTITTPGTYQIAADIYAANNLTDSYYVTVDGTPASGYLWDTHHSTSYATDLVSDRGGANPIEITLTAGDHTIDFYAREPDTRLDTFELLPAGP